MAKVNVVKLHAAAFYFSVYSQNAGEIARHVNVSERTVHRWAALSEWQSALDALGYTGEREFVYHPKRDTQREHGAVYDHAKAVYLGFYNEGVSKYKLASLTAEVVRLPREKISRWARTDNWRGETHERDQTAE